MKIIITFKYFFPAVLFFLTVSFLQVSQAQDSTAYKTNYEILSGLLSKSISKIEDRIITAGKEKTYLLSFNDNASGNGFRETNSFFQSLISQKMRDYKILSDNSLSFDNKILISSPVLSVLYSGIKTKGIIGNKFVKRECKVSYLCTVENSGTDDVKSFRYNETFTDEIPVDKIPMVEDINLTFTRSELPKETTFSKILLPAAIIFSTAAAIVLFFTIRK